MRHPAPTLTLLLMLTCASSPNAGQRLCDAAANPLVVDATHQPWSPPERVREHIWSQVLSTAVESHDDHYGTPAPASGPLCFLRSTALDSLVVYTDVGGASVAQPFTFSFETGTWVISYGESGVVFVP